MSDKTVLSSSKHRQRQSQHQTANNLHRSIMICLFTLLIPPRSRSPAEFKIVNHHGLLAFPYTNQCCKLYVLISRRILDPSCLSAPPLAVCFLTSNHDLFTRDSPPGYRPHRDGAACDCIPLSKLSVRKSLMVNLCFVLLYSRSRYHQNLA